MLHRCFSQLLNFATMVAGVEWLGPWHLHVKFRWL